MDGEDFLKYEPDPRHAEILMDQMGLNMQQPEVCKDAWRKKGDYYD